MGGDPLAYVVISAPSEASGRELIVNCYLEDTVYRSLSFSLGGNYEDGSDSYYTGFRYLAGREYLETSVTIGYPAYVAETMGYVPFDRIEIADPATGNNSRPRHGPCGDQGKAAGRKIQGDHQYLLRCRVSAIGRPYQSERLKVRSFRCPSSQKACVSRPLKAYDRNPPARPSGISAGRTSAPPAKAPYPWTSRLS